MEIRGPGQLQGHRRGGHQHNPGRQGEGQILAPRRDGLGGFLVNHQWIGGDGKDLVKNNEGQQVGREGHTQSCRQAQGKAGEVAGLVLFLETPDISDGVKRSQNPETGSDQCEEDPQRVGPQGQVDPG